jgi:hypothetical protein
MASQRSGNSVIYVVVVLVVIALVAWAMRSTIRRGVADVRHGITAPTPASPAPPATPRP